MREYARCRVCGAVVYRIRGNVYGDGQQDTDNKPVWLFADWKYIETTCDLQIVDCGCAGGTE